MTVTKADITESIYGQCAFSKTKSIRLVESLLEIIKKTLENGEDVLISGFGKFCVSKKYPRRGRNPQTGNGITLDARRIINFRCSHVESIP